MATVGASLSATLPIGSAAHAQGAPAAAKGPKLLEMDGKAKLAVLGDRPLVAETQAELLDDNVTPTNKLFIRNNGQVPDITGDPKAWKIKIDGEVNTPLEISVGDLMSKFPAVTYQLMLECGGNGRSFFTPEARGNQWTNGGAGCPMWTGVRLADVLQAAGLKDSAKFTGSWGADPHLSGDPDKRAMSRGNPIAKSLDPHTLIVWAINGEPLPNINGGPVRLLVPGWPGSLSTKWLTTILVRSTPHDGAGMGGTSYRVPVTPIVPGSNDDGKSFRDLEVMPIRSIVTSPANGTRLPAGARSIALRGAAWGSASGVARVEVSADAGQTWQQAATTPPTNPFDWTRWTHTLPVPSNGYFEIWVRATDRNGVTQPLVATNWNPQGYGSNPVNRIAVLVG